MHDAVASDAAVEAQNIGRRVILPATFTGSPRHMHEYAQDALSYVRAYDRPDLLITFICNPGWQEITELLQPGQTSSDRPDIGARVIQTKIEDLDEIYSQTSYLRSGAMLDVFSGVTKERTSAQQYSNLVVS